MCVCVCVCVSVFIYLIIYTISYALIVVNISFFIDFVVKSRVLCQLKWDKSKRRPAQQEEKSFTDRKRLKILFVTR